MKRQIFIIRHERDSVLKSKEIEVSLRANYTGVIKEGKIEVQELVYDSSVFSMRRLKEGEQKWES